MVSYLLERGADPLLEDIVSEHDSRTDSKDSGTESKDSIGVPSSACVALPGRPDPGCSLCHSVGRV